MPIGSVSAKQFHGISYHGFETKDAIITELNKLIAEFDLKVKSQSFPNNWLIGWHTQKRDGLTFLRDKINSDLNRYNLSDTIDEVERRYPNMYQSLNSNQVLGLVKGIIDFYEQGPLSQRNYDRSCIYAPPRMAG